MRHPETTSQSERGFRDALSAWAAIGKTRPTLRCCGVFLYARAAQSSILRGTGLALKRDMGSRSLIDIASILGWGFARRIRVFASRTRAGFGRLSASSPARYKRSAFA